MEVNVPLAPLAMPLITDPGASVSYIGIYSWLCVCPSFSPVMNLKG